eukprot:scaffold218697_cov18-Tisochrysis_lutea.AAC.2
MQEDKPEGGANGVDPSSEKKKKKKVRQERDRKLGFPSFLLERQCVHMYTKHREVRAMKANIGHTSVSFSKKD